MSSLKPIIIPEQYPELDIRALIVCAGHTSAVSYLAEGRQIVEFGIIETPDTKYHYSDKEGFTASYGGVGTGTDKHNKEHYERVFLNFFIKKLSELDKKNSFDRIYIFIPRDIKKITLEKLPSAFKSKTEVLIGNLLKAHPLELIKRISFLCK